MPKVSLSQHPINIIFRGWRAPAPRAVRTALNEAVAPWRIRDIAEGGKMAQAAAERTEIGQIPAWAKENFDRELSKIILRHANGRPHLVREIAEALEPAERTIELYSGGDLSGPLALPERDYYQVSRDPVFSGLSQLPQGFFDGIGLSELAQFNLARDFRFLTSDNIKRLTNLTYRVFPRLSFYFENVSAFGLRPEMQGKFDQCWTIFFPQASFDAAYHLLKLGGLLVYLETCGFKSALPEVEQFISGMKELTKSDERFLFRADLSLELSRRIHSVPGYSDLALTVNIFQKVKENGTDEN